jgi:hypothetical protein
MIHLKNLDENLERWTRLWYHRYNSIWFMLASGVLSDQQLDERMQQRFASLAGVGYTREATEVKRQFRLCNAPMRTPPTPPQRPEACHRVHLDCTQTVSLFIAGDGKAVLKIKGLWALIFSVLGFFDSPNVGVPMLCQPGRAGWPG